MALLASGTLSARADASITVANGGVPYDLAATCSLSGPIVYVHARLTNAGASRAVASLQVVDTPHVLHGEVDGILIGGGRETDVTIPVGLDTRPGVAGLGPPYIVGTHSLQIWLATDGASAPSAPAIAVTIPASLCAGVAPPAKSLLGSSLTTRVTTPVTLVTPKPPFGESPTALNQPAAKLYVLAAPTSVTSVRGVPDCVRRDIANAFGCQVNIEAGNLILGWAWSDPANAHIDGYRIYQGYDAGGPFTIVKSTSLQLASMGLGIHSNNCFEVTAISGQMESAKSSPFCRKGGDFAVVTELAPNHVRTVTQTHHKASIVSSFGSYHFGPDTPGVVGHEYSSQQHTLGDAYFNEIWRTAWAFDLSSLSNNGPFVSARFNYTIDQSYSSLGNNYSCADKLGTGTEFWWQSDASTWIDGPFTISPPSTGPVISVDVTPIVAPWMAGQPNYGIVLRNSDENLGAFANTACDSSFKNVVLDVIHY